MSVQRSHTPSMTEGNIRPVVLCIFKHKGKILVRDVSPNHETKSVFSPPGGGMTFGEYSWDSVRKEIKKELGEEIENLSFLGASEQVNTESSATRHEIIFLFKGELANQDAYKQEALIGRDEYGKPLKAVWKPIEDFRRNRAVIYPEVILDML